MAAASLMGIVASAALGAADGFSPIDTNYKHPEQLSETFFNPFRMHSASDSGLQKREGALATNDDVIGALAHRGISGIVYEGGPNGGRVIIGDEVFGVGDELDFPEADKDDPSPLVNGASVILRAVDKNSLGLEVEPEGEPARHLTYSLRAFWRP